MDYKQRRSPTATPVCRAEASTANDLGMAKNRFKRWRRDFCGAVAFVATNIPRGIRLDPSLIQLIACLV
jgi:hypothetical protein